MQILIYISHRIVQHHIPRLSSFPFQVGKGGGLGNGLCILCAVCVLPLDLVRDAAVMVTP
jgi:hypothetical protein